ncbi:MAG: hypothetical protein O6826_05825 [Acidobacteria bacterium]|nr:hypothetical protein [Acidobacteriota bacterium]
MRDRRKRGRRKIFSLLRLGSSRRAGVWQQVIVLALIVVIAFFLLWFGSYLYDYQPEVYEPRYVERK